MFDICTIRPELVCIGTKSLSIPPAAPISRGDLVFPAYTRISQARGVHNAATGPHPIIASLTALNRREDIISISHELTSERRRLLRAGLIDALIDQDPAREVTMTVATMATLFGRTEVFPAPLVTPLRVYTMENCWTDARAGAGTRHPLRPRRSSSEAGWS
ncbi:MAG TPA: hypothetical protein DIU07_15925 [Rhodobacteraceae bacterium]|nr:hypothetical protein [Paracoccaceae bacterium]